MKAIREALTQGRVVDDPHTLRCYSNDFTEQEPVLPAAVAVPSDIAELRKIVQIANEHSLPIVPRCAGTNVGGLCIPSGESLIVDMSLLNKIEHINEKDMIAVIQPGVTWAQLSDSLLGCKPPLNFSYPLAPLYSSVIASCVMDGLGSLSLKHGTMSELIGGMEVLLPDGSFIRTGMAAVFGDRPQYWLSRAPLPDLSGLFVSWQGTTGIVTRMSVQTWRLPPHRRRLFILFGKLEEGFELVIELASRFAFCDDLAGITWPATHFMYRNYTDIVRDEDEPEFFAYMDIGGFSPEEFEWKKSEIDKAILKCREKSSREVTAVDINDLVKIAPSLGCFATQPTTLAFLIAHSLGGMTWVGAYGPLSRFSEAARTCTDVMKKHNVPPALVSRPMKGGHFGVLRFLTIFDNTNPDERARVRRMNEEIADVLLKLGFVPYKTPPWAWKKLLERMDDRTAEFIKKVRSLIDPKGIMNPGKLPL